MNNSYDNVNKIRDILPVVAAASETCGYCLMRRDEADETHEWGINPETTEAICESKHLKAMEDGQPAAQKHLQSICDGFAERDDKDLAYAERWRKEDAAERALASEPWPESVKRLTAVDPNLKLIGEHLAHAQELLKQCTYYDPLWTHAQSAPVDRITWRYHLVDITLIAGTLVSLSVSVWIICHW